MKPYVAANCVNPVVLWNPVDLGYAAVQVMRAVVDGKLQSADQTSPPAASATSRSSTARVV